MLFSYGSLSNQRWEERAGRIATWFPDCRIDRYVGLHHLRTSHQAEPGRVAQALHGLWGQGPRLSAALPASPEQ